MAMVGQLALRRISNRARFMALISYISVLCLIPLIFDENDPYVRFHARQGVILWIWGVLAIFSLHLPGIGGFIFSASAIMITLMSLYGMLSVLLSKNWRLPFLARLATIL